MIRDHVDLRVAFRLFSQKDKFCESIFFELYDTPESAKLKLPIKLKMVWLLDISV